MDGPAPNELTLDPARDRAARRLDAFFERLDRLAPERLDTLAVRALDAETSAELIGPCGFLVDGLVRP
ncbi:MAG TPA: hypothetical protein VGK63_00770 [Candidatus Limnocylindrales bacterium]